jgi:hypothetical protein
MCSCSDEKEFDDNWNNKVVRCPDSKVTLGNWSQMEIKNCPPDWCPDLIEHLKLEGKLKDYLNYINHE